MSTIRNLRPVMRSPRCRVEATAAESVTGRDRCLDDLLDAFADIAERDDIHQAAERLARVQEWIRQEAARAAGDPIFDGVRLAS